MCVKLDNYQEKLCVNNIIVTLVLLLVLLCEISYCLLLRHHHCLLFCTTPVHVEFLVDKVDFFIQMLRFSVVIDRSTKTSYYLFQSSTIDAIPAVKKWVTDLKGIQYSFLRAQALRQHSPKPMPPEIRVIFMSYLEQMLC